MKSRVNFVGLGLLCVGVASAESKDVTNAFMQMMSASMTRMDRGMADAPMNGDVDHDFATMMIPHHQGAIDMARAELSYGRDPILRRLAQEIIVDQQSEIDAMTLRLTRNAAITPKER